MSNVINYKGVIKVKIKNGKDKVIHSRQYTNNGALPLFQFLSDCLRGEYVSAEKYRPKAIVLFGAKFPHNFSDDPSKADKSITEHEKSELILNDVYSISDYLAK